MMLTALNINQCTLVNLNIDWNHNPMNIWDLSRTVRSKRMILLNTAGTMVTVLKQSCREKKKG